MFEDVEPSKQIGENSHVVVNKKKSIFLQLNTSYLTESYIVFTLKMESVSKNTNDGEKWSRKNIFEIPSCGRLLSLTS